MKRYRVGLAVALGAACALLIVAPARAQDLERIDLAVTVYNEDRAVVYDVRKTPLEKGLNSVLFADVAALIDPTSVQLASQGAPFTIREQNFDYDVAGDAQLLYKYLGRAVTLDLEGGGTATGRLIIGPQREKRVRDRRSGTKEEIIYRLGDVALADDQGAIHIFPLSDVKSFALVPTGERLLTRPTLNWLIESAEPGERNCEIAYMTAGMSWRADYKLSLPPDPAARILADLTGVVTINNGTGTTYPDARLKLVAGDVHMIEEERPRESMAERGMMLEDKSAEAEPQFEERGMFEYHLYDLKRRTTLASAETKQIEFLRAGGIPMDRFFVYDGALIGRWGTDDPGYGTACDKRVWTYVEFKNSEENHVGMPLPRGKVRLVEAREGGEELVGEDAIDHTPRDEKVTLLVGRAFDLVGERAQTNFKRGDSTSEAQPLPAGYKHPPLDPGHNTIEESFEIAVRSARRATANVRVVEHLNRYADWEITAKSDEFEKTDAKTLEFRFALEPGEQKKITYTVRYRF